MNVLLAAASSLMGAAWEVRRRGYARGLWRTTRAPCRVVSIGNLTTGGTGKTTLTLHLAARARDLGVPFSVVCRRYRPGPDRRGDEELLYRGALPEKSVLAGRIKRDLALEAAASGARLVLVDDGFSHWALERDLDIVLLDARDPWGGERLLPAGRLREPRRALQRAEVVVVSRLTGNEIPAQQRDAIARWAPAAHIAGARHRVRGFRALRAGSVPPPPRVHLVTAVGNPDAVRVSAEEAGCGVVSVSAYRDHHWFSQGEARGEIARAESGGAVVLMSEKDVVRWPGEGSAGECVIEVEWTWVSGGAEVERRVFEGLAS